MDKVSRLILANQFMILEKVDPENAEHYGTMRKIVEYGFSREYNALKYNIDDEMSDGDCEEVVEILEMWSTIQFSFTKLKDKGNLSINDVKFQGFDANELSKHFSYSKFLLEELDKFSNLKENSSPDLNSHFEIIDYYRSMLYEWKKMEKSKHLTHEQIKILLNVNRQPI
jgi:uncharacterized protein YfbU (UPF0304 family)